jgi:hypothetical protein
MIVKLVGSVELPLAGLTLVILRADVTGKILQIGKDPTTDRTEEVNVIEAVMFFQLIWQAKFLSALVHRADDKL